MQSDAGSGACDLKIRGRWTDPLTLLSWKPNKADSSMTLKCTLQPTCAIPTPVLSILFGRIPQVSTVVKDISEDPSQEAKIRDDDESKPSKDDEGRARTDLYLPTFLPSNKPN